MLSWSWNQSWKARSAWLAILSFALATHAGAQSPPHDGRTDVSPVRGIERDERARPKPGPRPSREGVRTIDGSENNPNDPEMGAAETPLLRIMAPDYGDGISTMAGADREGARAISNAVAAQDESIPNPLGASSYLWQWGQFLDHDIDLTDGVDPPELEPIAVPTGDAWFDPDGDGDAEITFNRSIYDEATGTDLDNPREQINEITAWIDASNVYGSDAERAEALRTMDGTGRLATSDGDYLPYNVDGHANAGGPDPSLYLAGDVRANEQIGLTAMHTLFVREHNRLAARIAERHPEWSGDEIYEKARQLVGAEMQVITYREFLPALLGPGAMPPYRGYDPQVDGRIANLFSSAAYRFGHSALPDTLLRLDAEGNEIAEGHLPLRNAFFAPYRMAEGGMAPLLRGLAAQPAQRVDSQIIDDVRNFLFGEPGAGGFDLAALNIQRGRDHGLPSYNDVRAAFGFDRTEDFAQVTQDPETQARLAAVYSSPDEIDLWVGGLAEDPVPGSHVGPLFQAILVEQFDSLRAADRFWYTRVLTRKERERVESLRLADVIRLNTEIRDEIPNDVFRVEAAGRLVGPPRR